MEQINNTSATHPAKDRSRGRVMKWIGPDRPDPVLLGSPGSDITILVSRHAPFSVSFGPIGPDNRSKCKID